MILKLIIYSHLRKESITFPWKTCVSEDRFVDNVTCGYAEFGRKLDGETKNWKLFQFFSFSIAIFCRPDLIKWYFTLFLTYLAITLHIKENLQCFLF